MYKVPVIGPRGRLVLKCTTSTVDKRLTKGRVYEGFIVWVKEKSANDSHWRFLVVDNRGETMTFDIEAFTTS